MNGVSLEDLPSVRGDQRPLETLDERTQTALRSLERKARAREINVPTDDARVKQHLRALGHPITLFGEGPAERRDRLRDLLLDTLAQINSEGSEQSDEEAEEEFYTPGSDALLECRRWLTKYSLSRTKERIERERNLSSILLSKMVAHRREFNKPFSEFTAIGSQIAAERPACIARVSPDSNHVLVGSWSGQVKLFSIPNLEEVRTISAHSDRIGGISWNPFYHGIDCNDIDMDDLNSIHQSAVDGACKDVNEDSRGSAMEINTQNTKEHADRFQPAQSACIYDFASSGADGLIRLWSLKDTSSHVAQLSGHTGRVGRIDIHPSGRLLASAGFDMTWRLWDLETQKELLLQEGHAREVYAVKLQDDGALCVSGGLDAIGRVWDLRTGRTIMVLDGHIREITSIDFRLGHQIATGSADDSIKIWDLRMVACKSTIPAHNSLVSDIRFLGGDLIENDLPRRGNVFVSSGYDGQLKLWSSDDWQPLKSLAGHDQKVMSCDISPNGRWIVSSGFDRTLKLWAHESVLY